MRVFLFGELNEVNIMKLCPGCRLVGPASIKGAPCCGGTGRAYVRESTDVLAGFVVDCPPAELWTLDQWKDVTLLKRTELAGGLQTYVSLYGDAGIAPPRYAAAAKVEDFAARIARGTIKADVHLLVPGSVSRPLANAGESFLGRTLQERINVVNAREYNSEFLKNCERYALGKIEVAAKGGGWQNAVLTVMENKGTGLCVLDIFIPAVATPVHWLLEKYCGDRLTYRYHGEELQLNGLCGRIGITKYGDKRSLIFAYEKLDTEKLINLLANEETPMGKIMGKSLMEMASDNIAQYDTAEVYASEVSMLEMTDTIENDLFARIKSQGVEIFFVEMLLLQDAAVSKMYQKVQKEIAAERAFPLRKNAENIIADLVDESAYAVSFTDYKQFYYPTVRISAEKIAKAFGIDAIREKYERSKDILERMIREHKAEIDKKENTIKNCLLIILTLLSGITTVHEAFNFFTGQAYRDISYYFAAGAIGLGILIYFGIRAFVRWRLKVKAKGKPGQAKDRGRCKNNYE